MEPKSVKSRTTEQLAPIYRQVAVKWLQWERGMSSNEANDCLGLWPVDRVACEAIDVATFVVDNCHGR